MQEYPATIRRLSELDEDLARAALTVIDGRVINDDAVRKFLRDPSCYLLVAESNDNPVGTLNGYALRRPYRLQLQFLLYEVGVRRARQNQGIAERLVSAFVEEVCRCGAFEVWVLTERINAAAVRIYGQCGLSQENAGANGVMMNILLDSA